MSIYVYISQQCLKDAAKQNYTDDLRRFAKKIEDSQSIDHFDRFPPPHLKKRFERQIRVIATEKDVADHTVVALLRLVVRGGAEYKQFKESQYRDVPGVEKMSEELSPERLNEYIESRQDPPPPPPSVPSEEEGTYLHHVLTPSANLYHNSHVCETHLWVERISGKEFEPRLSDFIDPILDTIDHPDQGISELRCSKNSDFGILFRRIPEAKMVILLTPFRGNAPVEEVRKRFGSLLDPGTPFNHEQALQKAKRAYSHDLVLTEDAWFEIQRDGGGSMALSIEEVDVLESVRNPAGGSFPLFINGRAGSGKSTILQYLFSEFLYHHLAESKEGAPPVLFACNDLLLDEARKSVRRLLKARHRQTKGASDDSWMADPDFERRFSSAFRNFYSALLDLLPLEDRDRFARANLIDYGRFKAWWERRFSQDPSARKLYDADRSWHVIRTYIKGTSVEGLLDPDDYEEIPAKHKTVTPETYGIVFEKVWSRYAQDLKERGLWDHQDLARYVLDKNLIKPVHPALLCDEAQDFTRIELEIIDRHSLFNHRTLQPHEADRVPVAFAGDPFQTLNPTGFRWESTKAFFVEKFIKGNRGRDGRKEINFQELSYNYRSSQNIVRFCNSLQLVRSVVFDIPEIRPQIHWHDEENSPNVAFFERSNAETLAILKQQSEIRIIVPCEEGMESEWVRQNGLAEFVDFDEENVAKNVVSAVRVKGLEFPRVVLFGFGGECPPALKRAIRNGESFPEGDQSIEPQYFLNRLYVAASRPRRRLFIIDHQKDYEEFWNPIFEKQDAFAVESHDPNAWETGLGSLVPGDTASWENDKEDPEETAKKLAEEGRLRKDRVLLRQAAQSYDAANLPTNAKRCRAEALELEEQWVKAAKLWDELGDPGKAVKAAWQSPEEGATFLLELARRHPIVASSLEYRFAQLLANGGTFETGIELLHSFQEAIADEKRLEEIVVQPAWRKAFSRFVDILLKDGGASKALSKAAYHRLKSISEAGMRIPPMSMGKVAFAADLFEEAYTHWERVDPSDRAPIERDYLRARMSTLPFPDYVDVAGPLLRKHQAIADAEAVIARLDAEDPGKLRGAHHAVGALAYRIVGRLKEGLRHIDLCNEEKIVVDYLQNFSSGAGDPDSASRVLAVLVKLLGESNQLEAMLKLMKSNTYGSDRLEAFGRLLKRHPLRLFQPFVKQIAAGIDSDSLRDDVKSDFAKLLNERFPADLGWRKEVHPLLLGRAYEEIGFFKDTLPFYVRLKSSPILSEPLKRLARERWVKVKLDQARRELAQGDKKRAENNLSEARVEFATLPYEKFDDIPDDLPNPLPEIDAETVEKADGIGKRSDAPSGPPVKDPTDASHLSAPAPGRTYQLTTDLGEYRVRINPAGTRLNVDHSDSLEQLSILMPDKNVKFEGENVAAGGSGRFEIPGWGMTLDLGRLADGEVILRLANGITTILPVAPVPSASPED